MFWKNYKHCLSSIYVGMALLFLLFGQAVFAKHNSANLTKLSISNTASSSRLILMFTQPAKYKVFTLSHPDRVVIDLEETQLKMDVKKVHPLPSIIKNIRIGYPKPSVLRLVLDTAKPMKVTSSSFKSKLVIDFYSSAPQKNVVPIIPSTTKHLAETKRVVIVIDPGHGGKDTGAIGGKGAREKDIVLKVAKRLAEMINRQPTMRAVLTRHGDYFVPLRGRLKLARKDKADLFVAIHADAYFNANASGASVYTLSRRGATSEAARWLAQRDNFSELGKVDLNELDNKGHLRSVLIDLAQTVTISDSLRLGTSLLDSLENVNRLHYSRVEQAPFVVLKSPDIPSVLVEVGFISNPKEEMHLCSSDYQNKLARALFNGIQQYVSTYSILLKA